MQDGFLDTSALNKLIGSSFIPNYGYWYPI